MKNEAEVINRLKSYEPLWDDWAYNGKLYGSGGSGCVLGLSKGEERSVVKVIYIEDNQLKYNAVKDEIETMATLRSEYLVECLDYRIEKVNNQKGEKIGYDFLIHMNEYEPFSEFLREEEYDPNEVCVQLAKEIGGALCVLHSNGILHRDIKPENIFIDNSNGERHFRLGDFGVSKRIGDMSGLTTTGTLNFMAPESFKYYEYSYRSDIYNLGMTLYYILNDLRFPVFSEEESQSDFDYNTDCRLHGEKLPQPVCGSDELKKVVLKCCEANPKDRYKDISEALNELFGQSIPKMGVPLKKSSSTVTRKRVVQNKGLRVLFIATAAAVFILTIAFSILTIGQNTTINNSKKYSVTRINQTINDSRKIIEHMNNNIIKTFTHNSNEISITSENMAIIKTQGTPIHFQGISLCKYECYFNNGRLFYIYSDQGDYIYQIFLYNETVVRVKIGGKNNTDETNIAREYYVIAKNAQKLYDDLKKENPDNIFNSDKGSVEYDTTSPYEDNTGSSQKSDNKELNASSRYISRSDLSGMTLDEVQLAINEIYAKHGYYFSEEPYKSIFESYDWYSPDTTNMDVVGNRLNEYENQNLKVLGSYRNSLDQ